MNQIPRHSAPRNPWPFRIGFGAFLILLGGGFFAMMTLIAPALEKWRDEDTIIYKCEKVISGDTLVLVPVGQPTEKTIEITVRILGIEAPPLEPARQAAFAERLGIPVERVARLANSSRGALSVWILKRENLQVDYDSEVPQYDAQKRVLAHVDTSKVDVGKIQLRNGQALVTEESHRYRGPYTGYEEEARSQGFGIWRRP